MRHAPLLLSVVLPAVLLSGCGGSSTGSPLPSPTGATSAPAAGGTDKAAFVAKAEAICTDGNKKIEALDAQTPSDAAGLVAQLTSELGVADSTTAELEALPLPAADAATLTKDLLVPLRGQITVIRAYLPKLKAAAPHGQEAIEALGDPKLPTGDVAYVKAYGLPTCADALDTN